MTTHPQEPNLQASFIRIIDAGNLAAIHQEAAAGFRQENPQLAEKITTFSEAERGQLAAALQTTADAQQLSEGIIHLVATRGSEGIAGVRDQWKGSAALRTFLTALEEEAVYQEDEAIGD